MVEQSSSIMRSDVAASRHREAPSLFQPVPLSRRLYWFVKRVSDITIALTALVSLAPFLLLIAILIKLDSKGPVLFAQERIGYDPKTRAPRSFRFYKFRSMQHCADTTVHREHVTNLIKNRVALTAGQQTLKLVNDRRITRVGRVLRDASLDELPQLINVVKGDMSLIGPRPGLPYEVELYEEWHKRRLEALPGITGYWQVKGRNRVSFDEMVRMDLEYIENQGILLDLEIMVLTPWAVVSGSGAG
jgi:lipopolysaccharide/colanic/teichoic acid biosynthesis glycosyltransferase